MRGSMGAVVGMALLAGCAPAKQDLLTSGIWTCISNDELKLALTFAKGGKLDGQIESLPAPAGTADAISLKMDITGHWALARDEALFFGFDNAKMIEAKRGSAALTPEESEIMRLMFESWKISATLPTLSKTAMVMAIDGKEKPISCTK